MYKHILIPTDGSPLADEGVREAIALAKALGAKATAVVVSEPYLGLLLPGEARVTPAMKDAEIENEAEAAAKRVLDSVVARALAAGVPCEPVHVRNGLAADGILAAAARAGCDLIVLASHGRRGVRRLLLGSQANEVLTRATIPVMIVRSTDA